LKKFNFFFFLAFFVPAAILAQTATLQGIILNEEQLPVAGANVIYSDDGTITDQNGYYQLEIPANKEIQITISYLGYENISRRVNLPTDTEKELNFELKTNVEQISQVVITDKRTKAIGVSTIEPEIIRKIPGANAGVENLLKSLPGVSSNNELSTQYSVRGGNYDENLVYVNGIEVYRPFLIRSGQQEGLSFVNTDLVRSLEFSAGGFQAKYGDKLSSVLDIQYRRPVDFGATADLSLLGASASVEGISKNKKLSGIIGLRYRDNSLLVKARETETNYQPAFADVQAFLTYQFSDKFELGFLGNLSLNKYSFEPTVRETNFGTLSDPKKLFVFYEGQEEDRYYTAFGALKASYEISKDYTARLITSVYNTQEQEYYDIVAAYRLSEDVNTDFGSDDFGEAEFFRGAGTQHEHARNDLDAFIVNIAHQGTYTLNSHQFDYGIKYTHEDIIDRIREYEIIASVGFNVRPPFDEYGNDQPYEPYDAPIVPYTSMRGFNETQIDRMQGFVQWSNRAEWGNNQVWYNLGVRAQNWTVSGKNLKSTNQSIVSPRAQFAIKPNWDADMLFRLSGGFYHQPPFYRELRDSTGTVRPEVEAQKSVHLVLGNEYSFRLWERPFKLVSEAYYKKMTDVNPYTLENVRIRYAAENNAEAYAYGVDLRLNGEFVPGTESWVSVGFLKTEVNIDEKGYIARPTDQRLKFAAVYQDYVPTIPNLKLYLNLVYNTGLPGGSPNYADAYDYQLRLPNYFRTDVGFFYVLVDENKQYPKGHLFHSFENLSLGFEIFNLFDYENSITNIFVRDVLTKTQYAIPNQLTPRVFNLRISMGF